MIPRLLFLMLWITTSSCTINSSKKNLSPIQSEKISNLEILTSEKDSLIFHNLANQFKDKELSVNDYIIDIGEHFSGTLYVTSTLETESGEKLVVNLREMDCTTFVEYVIALSLCFSENLFDFNDFAQMLVKVRYYDGKIDGYPSRLHYFSGWLQNNSKKGILDIVSDSIGNKVFDNKVNFMTSNSNLYRQLSDTALIRQLEITEREVSSHEMRYITKDNIPKIENSIKNGDIIAFASSIKGLDVSHVGFAVNRAGRIYFMHASSGNKQVEITSVPLDEYLRKLSSVTDRKSTLLNSSH